MNGDINLNLNLKINKKIGLSFLFLFSIIAFGSFVSVVDAESNGGVTVVQDTTPVGTIAMWGTSTPPTDWIELNGQSTAGYPKLAAIYGSTVPDFRGEHVRGWDNGKGIDSGRTLLSNQDDAVKGHNHDIKAGGNHGIVTAKQNVNVSGDNAVFSHYRYGNGSTYSLPSDSDTAKAISSYLGTEMSSENRVKNISVMFIVKAK